MWLVAVSLGLVVVVVATLLTVRRRRARRELLDQIGRLAARLDPEGPEPLDASHALDRLRRRADDLAARAAGAESLAALTSAVLDEMPLGVMIADAGGEVLFRNSSAAHLAGDRPAAALAARAVTELMAAAGAGHPATRTLELYGPPSRSLVLSAVPLDGAGRPGPAAVVIEDVSERRRLEIVRRDFVANVGHELKTPVGALGLLAETLAGEDDAEVVHRLAGRLQAEAFRVARIVEDLLDLSRLEAEEGAVHAPVRVESVVSEAVEQARPAVVLRQVEIAVSEGPSAMEVLGDHRQLVSALLNLLDNAVKYSDPGSTVEVGARLDGDTVELVVRDQGIGIPARDIDRVFERFYRVDPGRSRDTGGTGLGLAIVRHVAANHDGEVLVESREGEGSTFRLRLPVHRAGVRVGSEGA